MSPHIAIAAEKILYIGSFPLTNALISSWVAAALLISGAALLRRSRLVPSGLQNIMEIVVEKFLGIMEGMFSSRRAAEQYFPLVATIFLFVLVSNWLGVLPGIGSIGFFEKIHDKTVLIPLFRSAASDLNFTLALSIITVILVNVFGIAAIGFWKHAGKYVSFRGPIEFFVGVLELISEAAKIVSFSFRLFGNIFAGEVLLVITGFLAPFFIPVPFLALELFVGFIQALVFSMLTMVFISIAVSHY